MMQKTKYKHIFFDLDRTLWDFERNSHEVLTELFYAHKLDAEGIPSADTFILKYKEINEACWAEYRRGTMDKNVLRSIRFSKTLAHFNCGDEERAVKIGDDYVRICPQKTNLLPHTTETLEYLHDKYILHIITNGFEEAQHIKLQKTGLTPFFKDVITSEQVGHKKPDKRVFQFAINRTGAANNNSLMVGDDLEVDILGASAFGMDQVYFNPNVIAHEEKPTYEISLLKELQAIL